MIINGLVVCVNYAQDLALGLERWITGLDSLTVVTSHRDSVTPMLVAQYAKTGKVQCVVTDLFYADGCTFNKGRAMEFARKYHMPFRDWALFFDADVVPPPDWRMHLEVLRPQPGNLYGARRNQCHDKSRVDDQRWRAYPLNDVPGVGFFQLFHTGDPVVVGSNAPLLDTFWLHAGNYDDCFRLKWPAKQQLDSGLRLTHIGERDNWWGRGNKDAFIRMQSERIRRRGWQHERIAHVPID